MESRPFFLCWARVSVGMGKGSVLSFSNFFDIVDLNRDVESSMEFFCSPVCFMHFAAWYETHLNLKLIVSSWAHAVRQSRRSKHCVQVRRVLRLTREWQRAQWEQWVTVFRAARFFKEWVKLVALPDLVDSSSTASVASLISITDSSTSDDMTDIIQYFKARSDYRDYSSCFTTVDPRHFSEFAVS